MLFQKVIIIQCGGFHAHLTNKQILLHQEDHQVQPTCCGEPLNRETTQSSFHEYIHCSKKEKKKKDLIILVSTDRCYVILFLRNHILYDSKDYST